MTASLLDRWCPEPHDAPITAAAFDPSSGAMATADALGTVAIFPPRRRSVSRLISHTAGINRALAVSPGGALVGVGDDDGTFAVYRTSDGAAVYVETREGDDGARRAMRGVRFSPDGRMVASLAIDGRIRVTDLERRERIATFTDFSGHALDWDPAGHCLVGVNRLLQPTLIQLASNQLLPFQLVPGGAHLARFSPDGRFVLLLGDGGLTLVDASSLEVQEVRDADQNSRMLDMAFSPQGNHIAVITTRSVHYFQVQGLRHVGKQKHGCPTATGVAVWDATGVAVAGKDARLHRPDTPAPFPATVCAHGRGPWRVAAHEHMLALWKGEQRVMTMIPKVHNRKRGAPDDTRPMLPEERIVEAQIDIEGKVLVVLPEGGPVHVYDARKGKLLFQAGPDTIDTPRLEVGLGIVASLLPQGGVRWFDLRNNRTYELDWAQDFSITGGGTWMAVLTPQGRVHIIDPATGVDSLPPLTPVGDASVRLLSFVHRRPELLVLDDDGVLGLHDLAPAARDGAEPVQHRIAAFYDAEIDAIWGLEDGRHAVVRIQESDKGTSTFVTVDLDNGEIVHKVEGLLPYASLDPGGGIILEPARGSAVLELSLDGRPLRVLRSLPRDEWVSFDERKVLASSAGARDYLDGRPRT
jgi:WD40 repeat protein